MNTTDTPRWTVTQFNSALLEHDGETCNEIFCISRDEAECLVDLLNEWTERAEKAEAEVERLKSDKAHLITQCANLLEALNPTEK